MAICKIGKLHQIWHWGAHKMSCCTNQFQASGPLDLSSCMITIFIPLKNAFRAIVFESKETLL